MSNEFEDLSTTPTLTLDPFQAQEEKKPPVEAEKQEPALDESILTEEERKTVDEFAKQIDLTIPRWCCSTERGRRKRWLISQRLPWKT